MTSTTVLLFTNICFKDYEYDGGSITKKRTKTKLSSSLQRDNEGRVLLPRWRPYEGVSNDNSEFRSSSPKMTSEGYARSIRRHSRKRNKSSMWKYALRLYFKLVELEGNVTTSAADEQSNPTAAATEQLPRGSGFARTTAHYEGALVSCSKLGLWMEAFQIFNDAKVMSEQRQSVRITDHMVLSTVRACIRASAACKRGKMVSSEYLMDENRRRRAPLDAATDLILKLEVSNIVVLPFERVSSLTWCLVS